MLLALLVNFFSIIFHYSLQVLLYLQLFVLIQAVAFTDQCPLFPLSLLYFDANLVIVTEDVPYYLVSSD